MSRLNDLLRQLEAKDPSLAKELRTEYDALADRRAFGLNFERHTPESVELPGRPIRRGDKVHVLPERGRNPKAENSRLWQVTAIDRASGTATIQPHDGSVEPAESHEQPLTELVAVAEFRDPIYPGLVSTGRVERGGDKPFHTVINAENYHALQTLLFTHRGQVDCIYIDPPYNTGNEGWIYNDDYVADDDHYKHSKWLAFMERRLLLAKELLKPAGVIIVAIGDDEHHRLRMLMDQCFDSSNFLTNLIWQGGVSALAKHTGGGVDYMLIYAKNRDAHVAEIDQWRIPKEGTDEVLAAGQDCWARSGQDAETATELFRAWWKSNRKRFDSGVSAYDRIDASGRIFFAGDLANGMYRPNLQYDIPHPVTGRAVRMPKNGWRHEPKKMQANIDAGMVLFGPDETTIPTLKRYLEDYITQVPPPSFYRDRRSASVHLSKILGDQRFPNSKETSVIGDWLRTVAPSDATILDFFGGSGTTAEATMRLNLEDGGSRSCVLVTNNELAAADATKLSKAGHRPGDAEWEERGVYEHVAKPRISTVVTGVRPDGSTYSDGLEQNVEFLTLTYEAPLAVSNNRAFERIAPLLWMRAGSQGRRIDDIAAGWDVADTYGVLADLDQSEAFLKALAQREADGAEIRLVFIVTDEERLFTSVCRELPEHVEAVRLYEAYLRNFEIEAGRSTR